MKKSELIVIEINKIHDNYTKLKNYDLFCNDYLNIIKELEPFWNKLTDIKPLQNDYCLCIENFSSLGKGVFVEFLFFKDNGFFANIDDDDPYGMITHWISVNDLDS